MPGLFAALRFRFKCYTAKTVQRNTARLEQLLDIQAKAQASWKTNRIFESDAPVPG